MATSGAKNDGCFRRLEMTGVGENLQLNLNNDINWFSFFGDMDSFHEFCSLVLFQLFGVHSVFGWFR